MDKTKILLGALGLGLVATAIVVFFTVKNTRTSQQSVGETPAEEEGIDELPPAPDSISVGVGMSKTEPNTVVITAKGLGGMMRSVAYELTYESEGLIKGVNSGSKPIDVTKEDSFTRSVYLGTCSRNVCRPDPGVTRVSLVLQFTDTDGKRSQFSGEFTL